MVILGLKPKKRGPLKHRNSYFAKRNKERKELFDKERKEKEVNFEKMKQYYKDKTYEFRSSRIRRELDK
ncbi:MAG: hypothetical protein V1824_00425 [archaeon]